MTHLKHLLRLQQRDRGCARRGHCSRVPCHCCRATGDQLAHILKENTCQLQGGGFASVFFWGSFYTCYLPKSMLPLLEIWLLKALKNQGWVFFFQISTAGFDHHPAMAWACILWSLLLFFCILAEWFQYSLAKDPFQARRRQWVTLWHEMWRLLQRYGILKTSLSVLCKEKRNKRRSFHNIANLLKGILLISNDAVVGSAFLFFLFRFDCLLPDLLKRSDFFL